MGTDSFDSRIEAMPALSFLFTSGFRPPMEIRMKNKTQNVMSTVTQRGKGLEREGGRERPR